MDRELIERIDVEISALETDVETFKSALGDDAELGAEIKTLAVLRDCKAALSQEAQPVASVPSKEKMRELFTIYHELPYNPKSEHYRFEHFYNAIIKEPGK